MKRNHEEDPFSPREMRIASPLSVEEERIMHQVIGAAISVHRSRFDEIHRAQLISYLRAASLRGGLLINFRVRVLQAGIRRIVLT